MTYEESEVASHNQTHWYFWRKMLSGISQHFITSYQFRPGQVLVPNLEVSHHVFFGFQNYIYSTYISTTKRELLWTCWHIKKSKILNFHRYRITGWWEWTPRGEHYSTEGKNQGGEESSHLLQEQGASPVEGQCLPPGPRGAAPSLWSITDTSDAINSSASTHSFPFQSFLFSFPTVYAPGLSWQVEIFLKLIISNTKVTLWKKAGREF